MLADVDGVHPNGFGQHVELGLEGKAHIDGAMAAHGATGWLIGQDPVAVVLDIADVVQGGEQGPGIENGHHAIAAKGATALNDPTLNRGDVASPCDAGLEVDDLMWSSAMQVKYFLAGTGDFHRTPDFPSQRCRANFVGEGLVFAAEAPTNERHDDPYLTRRKIQDTRQGK